MQEHLEIGLTVRGRNIQPPDILVMRQIIDTGWSRGRSFISREICKSLGWYQQNGRLKDRACRDILRTLEARGILKLPPSKQKKRVQTNCKPREPQKTAEILKWETTQLNDCNLADVTLEMVRWGRDEKLWNSLIRLYHYQGYSVIVGRHLKYLVRLNGVPMACLGWGEAAWHLDDRDRWIGWSDAIRRRNLGTVINNVRFLILPWVRRDNFASFVLSKALKIITKDWQKYYGVTPFLAETFVENRRFRGTCYQASNWLRIGTTKGFRRKGNSYSNHQVPKDIYIYPLTKNARARLNASRETSQSS